MKCHIEYVGKLRNGTARYYCTKHKCLASNKSGNKLEECLCNTKEQYENKLDIKNMKIESITIIYENILENVTPKIYINRREFDGIFTYENSILTYKDLSGVMLAKLNNIHLEKIRCKRCKAYHSDNGKFAYTPHITHLCLYCGHFFREKEPNIGSELENILDIPQIKLYKNTTIIKEKCKIEYDMLKGTLLVNEENVNQLIIKENKINIIDFLNKKLEQEF